MEIKVYFSLFVYESFFFVNTNTQSSSYIHIMACSFIFLLNERKEKREERGREAEKCRIM